MNEEIDEYLKTVKSLISIWDSTTRSIEVAKDLNLKLTLLKLMIGISNFNELDAFNRYLKETSKFINKLEGSENENEKK